MANEACPTVNGVIARTIYDIITSYPKFERARTFANLDQFMYQDETELLNAAATVKSKRYINALRDLRDNPNIGVWSSIISEGLNTSLLRYNVSGNPRFVCTSEHGQLSVGLTDCTNTVHIEPDYSQIKKHHEALCIIIFSVTLRDKYCEGNPKKWLDNFNAEMEYSGDDTVVTIDGSYHSPNCYRNLLGNGKTFVHCEDNLEQNVNTIAETLFRPFYNMVCDNLQCKDLICKQIYCDGFFIGESASADNTHLFEFRTVGLLGRD